MYTGSTMSDTREQLKAYMGERDLTIDQVAKMLGRHPLTIWKFLRGKTNPHDRTMYKIERLIERGSRGRRAA